MNASEVRASLREAAHTVHAERLSSYFKTGAGHYGEGDVFIGVRVPAQRQIANRFIDLPMRGCVSLLGSRVHEERLTALLILVAKFRRGDKKIQREIFDLYMLNRARVNNWDLVDTSAPQIVGSYLSERSRSPLYKLARSRSLWDRRIAIVATQAFIRETDLDDTFDIAEMLLGDSEDLIHKAVGWMLREAGDRDDAALRGFLDKHCTRMPRTMLRYAIEKFPEPERLRYLRRTGE